MPYAATERSRRCGRAGEVRCPAQRRASDERLGVGHVYGKHHQHARLHPQRLLTVSPIGDERESSVGDDVTHTVNAAPSSEPHLRLVAGTSTAHELKQPAGSEAHLGVTSALMLAGGRVATQLVLVSAYLIIPRVMGVEVFGRYSAVQATVGVLVVIAALGLPLLEVRFIAPAWLSGRRGEAAEFAAAVWATRAATGAAAGLIAAVVALLSPQLGVGPVLAAAVVLLVWLRCVNDATTSLLIPVGQARRAALQDLARSALSLPVVLIGFLWLGLIGAFWGLVVMYGALAITGLVSLRRVLPLSLHPQGLRWALVRDRWGFALSSFIGTAALALQIWLPVYALAVWTSLEQAAFAAIAVQASWLVGWPVIAAQQGVAPLLVRFEADERREQQRRWASLMMRAGAAGLCVGVVVWAIVGRELTLVLLGAQFVPVYPCVTLMLIGAMLYCAGAICSALLYARVDLVGAPLPAVAHLSTTLAGVALVIVLGLNEEEAAVRVSAIYAIAGGVYLAVAYAGLALRGGVGVWLPLRRTLLLMAPAALAWPAHSYHLANDVTAFGQLWPRLAASVALVGCYAAASLGLGLIGIAEIRSLIGALRRPRQPG